MLVQLGKWGFGGRVAVRHRQPTLLARPTMARHSPIYARDYRLIARLQYLAQVLAIRFFETHSEYDKIDAETV